MVRRRAQVVVRHSFVAGHRRIMHMILIGACLGGPIAIGFGIFVVVNDEEFRVRGLAQGLIEPTAGREQEILAVAALLDALNTVPCADADLEALRAVVIGSAIVQDVIRRESGRLVCSALYGRREITIPELAKPGYVISPEQTVWRHVLLKLAPGHEFLAVAHRDFILLVHVNNQPPYLRPGYLQLSRAFIDRARGHVSWFLGQPVDMPASALRSGATFWRGGHFTAVGCAQDQAICLTLSTTLFAMLRQNMRPFGVFALAGALTGSAASVLAMLWWRGRRSLYGCLRRAIRHGDLVLLYQPIVSAGGLNVVGAEALMRWPNAPGGPIGPDVFIPAAEDGGLIGELTCLAIETVGRDLGAFLRSHAGFTVSINIVADDLEDPRFHAALAASIVGEGISTSQVALELTERRAAEVEAATLAINELRRAGYKIYIDDFGTGFSSLSYLSDLSIDAIKLDKSFTNTVDTEAARARLVQPIMDMARDIGVPVIVEGVETQGQAAYFRRRGAASMQGWLFGRPVDAQELMRRVSENVTELRVVGYLKEA